MRQRRAEQARGRTHRFEALFIVLPCAWFWASCLSELRPDVGALVTQDADDAPVNASDGSAKPPSKEDGGSDAETPVPDAGTPMVEPNGCKTKDTDPTTEVSFKRDVWPILTGCRCHDPKSDDPQGILEASLTIDSYLSLRMGGDTTKENIIVAGNPCDSIILQKLSETPPFGARMPLDGPYLSPEARALLSDWILEGARDN